MEKKKNIKIEIKETNKNKKSKKHDDEDDIYEIDDDQDQKDNYFNIPEEEEYKDKNIHIEDEDKDLNELDNFPQEVEALNINLDMEEVSMRIKEITTSLTDFNSYKKNNSNAKNRSDLISELKQYCKIYYDYNEDIITLVMNLFAPNEAVEFLESSANQRIMSIRTNTLKIKRRELAKQLINRGVNLDPLAEWTKVGLKIYDSSVPIGATPEYLTGQYMLQSGSSFLPVMALEPKEGEKVLDMCAAPGGKTTYLAQLMKNTGVLVANDLKSDRIKSLYFNLHRLGVKNCIITNYDGTKICKQYNNFDRVLLDAPCSGLGVISKDPSVKVNRTYKDIIEITRVQKELLLSAIDCCTLKGAAIVVYSTCSISVEENEWVVDYALKNRYVKLLPIDIGVGEEGLKKFRGKQFHPSMNLTKRIYPHLNNMDGFFVAKLQKYADGPKIKNK